MSTTTEAPTGNLVIDNITFKGRTIQCNENLELEYENTPEILEAYFAKKIVKEESIKEATYTYTFEEFTSTNDVPKRTAIINKIQTAINANLSSEEKKATQKTIKDVINAKEKGKNWPIQKYAKDTTLTFIQYKTETKIYYEKIDSAPMGYQVYLVAETRNLKGKKVKLKILESKSQDQDKKNILKLVKNETDALPVLTFAKEEDTSTNTEVSDWIELEVEEKSGKKEKNPKSKKVELFLYKEDNEAKIEVGIKKIQLRPKEDKITTKGEDVSKSFEGWQEALYIREHETNDGKKVMLAEKKAKEHRKKEENTILKFDKDAERKTFQAGKIDAPKTAIVGKVIEYILDVDITEANYKKKYKNATEEDKKNIRWSFYVQGDPKATKADKEKTCIEDKSKAGLYTYAKTEVIDEKIKLTIIFDEALIGKKVQIEPFRGSPDLSNKPDFVRTTTIQKVPDPKISIRDKAHLYIKTKCDNVENADKTNKQFLKGGGFKLEYNTTIYIYSDGKISKTYLENGDKMRYVYVENNGEEHNLGEFKLIEAQNFIDATRHQYKTAVGDWKKVVSGGKTRYYKKDGNKKTLLMTPFSGIPNKVFKYKRGNLDFAIYESTDREYFNPEAFATVIGALVEVNFKDVVSNGSVDTDGTGAYSVTHFNGFNMDFKYLRKDKKKAKIDKYSNGNLVEVILSDNVKLDVDRQNQFLDALYKFGWGVNEKNLANKTSKNKDLNHCDPDSHHWNHLHIQGFKVAYK